MKVTYDIMTFVGSALLALSLVSPAGAQNSSSSREGARKDKKLASAVVLAHPVGQGVASDPADSSRRANEAKPGNPDSVDVSAGLNDYRIGIEDELQVAVWREPDLSQRVVVRPDGKITLPLINDVYVIGLTTDELRNHLTEKLRPFVSEPQVTVMVRTINSRKVYLLGNVGRQGSFALNGRKTVLELITEAGGLGTFAKKGSIYVLREQGKSQVRIPFNYKKVSAGRSADLELRPLDKVIVP